MDKIPSAKTVPCGRCDFLGRPLLCIESRVTAYPMLYRMLYACGFRINEVLGLRLQDVDLEKGIVHLTKTKNNIERLVPMSDSLTAYCKRFAADIHAEHPADFPFIATMHGEHYCTSVIERHFRDLLWEAGIPYGGKLLGPRVHDIRHPNVKLKTKISANF